MTIRVENLNTLDFSEVAEGRLTPVPPGEILMEEFLNPMGITQYRLAKAIDVPQGRIGEIVAGKRAITADTGLRLSRFFGMSDGFWVGLQVDFDVARANQAMGETLARIEPINGNRGMRPN